ncbi:MAG: PPOX class F420-dependent oxidoreductase [Nitrososphaerota archaeon]|nr:PPOX class F420-dependent oxidoreductase [Nitrososphaerota archaeon]MDG7048738.1 PPOX class F420-dependent oxidoreductase [Nitrososphaerota archaeon]MDG7051222.1 PPOX class F420-dependent oxidoreductase [Nitrososphaerota archaeon]
MNPKVEELINGKNFGYIASVSNGGNPHVTPVWIDMEGEYVLVNTAIGRVKQKNLRENAKVAIAVSDQANPYHYALVRGKIYKQTTKGADEHIDKLAKKYLGKDSYPWKSPNEQRVILYIKPERVIIPQ